MRVHLRHGYLLVIFRDFNVEFEKFLSCRCLSGWILSLVERGNGFEGSWLGFQFFFVRLKEIPGFVGLLFGGLKVNSTQK
jgi:hypothetical protein